MRIQYLFSLAIMITLAVVINPVAAFAAGATQDPLPVDLTPLADYLVEIIFGGLIAVVSWLVAKAVKAFEGWTGIQFEVTTRKYLDDAIYNGIAYGRTKLKSLTDRKLSDVEIDNHLVAQAVAYVAAKVPDALAYFEIDEDSLKELVEARLGHGLLPASDIIID